MPRLDATAMRANNRISGRHNFGKNLRAAGRQREISLRLTPNTRLLGNRRRSHARRGKSVGHPDGPARQRLAMSPVDSGKAVSRHSAGPTPQPSSCASWDPALCCATDGNHGRSVAFAAARFGQECVVHEHAPAGKAAMQPPRLVGLWSGSAGVDALAGPLRD